MKNRRLIVNDPLASIQQRNVSAHDDLTMAMLGEGDDVQIVERVVEKVVEVEVRVEVPVPVGLVRGEDGAIWVGNIAVLSTGIYINGEITQDEWEAFFPIVQRIQDASQWFYGDLVAYGDRVWGKTYNEVAAKIGIDADTLRNWAWVASSVDLSLRNDKLSFTHHYHVAGLSEAEQVRWLTDAVNNRWSANRLLEEISQQRPVQPSDIDKVTKFFSQARQKYDVYGKRFANANQHEKMQLARLIDDEIAALKALKQRLQ